MRKNTEQKISKTVGVLGMPMIFIYSMSTILLAISNNNTGETIATWLMAIPIVGGILAMLIIAFAGVVLGSVKIIKSLVHIWKP